MKAFKFLAFSALGVLLFGLGFSSGKVLSNINHITTEISKSDTDLGIDDSTFIDVNTTKKEDAQLINIALFGVDTRVEDSDSGTRSDSIIVLTIDQITQEIKLSSIMRDTYVQIPGYEKTKINHAYSYGGPELAIKTINSNFGLDIRDFITVDFFGLEKIIDAIGGITLNIEDYEIDEINKFIKEVADLEGKKATLLTRSGVQEVNGMQAVAYGRIRKVGNGDYERTERQRKVLTAIFDEVKTLSPTKALNLVNNCASYVKTSLDISDGIKLGLSILSGNYTIHQDRFPYDTSSEGRTINGMWVLAADINQTKKDMQKFIYNIEESKSESKYNYSNDKDDLDEDEDETDNDNSDDYDYKNNN